MSSDRVYFGAAMMAVGGLLAALCGTCSLAFAVSPIWGSFPTAGTDHDPGANLIIGGFLVAALGGLPTLAGVLLFRWGLRLYRPPPVKPTRGSLSFRDDEGDPP